MAVSLVGGSSVLCWMQPVARPAIATLIVIVLMIRPIFIVSLLCGSDQKLGNDILQSLGKGIPPPYDLFVGIGRGVPIPPCNTVSFQAE